MQQEEPWKRLLRDALAVLALPANEQVHAIGPGCVACELLNDFDHARMVALGTPDLSEERRGLLDRIEATMRAMHQDDFECFNSNVISRPVWKQLREMAAAGLRAFGWEGVVVVPAIELSQGAWSGPRATVSDQERDGTRSHHGADIMVGDPDSGANGGGEAES